MKNIFYNETKDFIRLNNCTEKVEIAISRLENPYNITQEQIEMYIDYLSKEACETVLQFIDMGKINIFPLLAKYNVIKKTNVIEFTDYARDKRKMDIMSYLMQIGNEIRKSKVKKAIVKPIETYDKSKYASEKAGEIIWLGEEAMPWTVLENKHGRLLVISMYAIDCKPFETFYSSKPWSKSTIRIIVNDEYMEKILTKEEIDSIIKVYIDDKDNLSFEETESSTDNKLFFLSVKETEKYLKTKKSRLAVVTSYATRSNLWTVFDQYAYWWLRSQGKTETDKYYVQDGELIGVNSTVEIWNYQHFGVRPAMYINFK